MSIFSERLVKTRKKRNITQRQLAEMLEITPTRLNYWEKGKREPDVMMINKISTTLNVRPDYLLGHIDEDVSLIKPELSKMSDLDTMLFMQI